MSNEFWTEFKRLAKVAERASGGNSAVKYIDAYMGLYDHIAKHAPSADLQKWRAAQVGNGEGE